MVVKGRCGVRDMQNGAGEHGFCAQHQLDHESDSARADAAVDVLDMSGDESVLQSEFLGHNRAWLLQRCQRIYQLRRERDRAFGEAGLFSEPAWDMILDLFIANLQNKPVSVTSVAVASCAPLTTALRWLSILDQNGIIVREPDPHDGRRVYIKLTDSAIESMLRLIGDA